MSLSKQATVPFKKYDTREDVSIYIVETRCKGCDFCVNFCPREILTLDADYYNSKGYHVPKIKPDKTTEDCADCKFCQLICPEFAIFVKEHEDDV